MKRRWLGVAIALLALPLFVLPTDSELGSPLVVDILGLIAFASPALVGAYLMWRLPENPVGWLLAGFGLTFTLGVIGETNAVINSPLATWGAWLGAWLWAMSMTLIIILLPLRFPDGRLPSPRYRWVTPVAAVGCLLVIFGNAFRASIAFPTDDGEVVVDLPLHLPLPTAVFDVAAGFGMILMLAAVGGAVLATIGRFRRSAGIERQQMKVFAGALAFSVTGMALNLVLYEVGNVSWANGVFALLVLVLVSSIALSVLRYRLYDFDRLVSRTVSYALVAGVLAAVYGFGAVWLPSQIVGEQTPIFIAGSTLAGAALFNPLRRRVMRWVDQKFNRSRYDPEQIADVFATRVRNQVYADRVADDWAEIVTRTLQPSVIGVWVRRGSNGLSGTRLPYYKKDRPDTRRTNRS